MAPISREGTDRLVRPFYSKYITLSRDEEGVSLRWEITPWASPMCWPLSVSGSGNA